MLHHPFPINFWDKIKDFVLEKTKHYASEDLYVEKINVPNNIQNEINRELLSYNLPLPTPGVTVFKRKNNSYKFSHFHVDGYDNILYSASLVIPIENCKNTYMIWADGDYSLELKSKINGIRFHGINWKSDCKVIEQKEIIEPTLCKVSVPHTAISDNLSNYRTIASIRFLKNLSFEELLQRRFKIIPREQSR